MAAALDRSEVLALRAAGHGLGARRPADRLTAAFAAAGLRDTRTTDVAAAARVEGVAAGDVDRALAAGRLVRVYGPRGTRLVVPPEDVAVFTVGAAPVGEASLRAAVPGAFLRHLDAAGVTVSAALAAVVGAVTEALAGGPRSRGETARAVTRAVPPALAPPCRGRCPDPHVEDSLFRLAGVAGAMRFDGDDDTLVALGPSATAPDAARTELVRRYLGCHGPSTPAAFAAWAGIAPTDARRSLDALGDEAVEATVDGRPAGVLLAAGAGQARAAAVEGVRLLPPADAWLLDRDRDTLVPERAAQRVLWRASGGPGVVLVDGEPVAAWRTRQQGRRFTLRVLALGAPAPAPAALQDEAERLAQVLGKDGPVDVVAEP